MRSLVPFVIVVTVVGVILILSTMKKNWENIQDHFVVFTKPYMLAAYNKHGVRYNASRGTLSKCDDRGTHHPSCTTLHHKWPTPNLNHVVSARLSHNKAHTSRIFELNNVPCPKFTLIDRPIEASDLERIVREYHLTFPLVAKPIDGTQGYGVYLDIGDTRALYRVVRALQQKGRQKIIVEEQVGGKNYRILVLNGEVVDILRRDLAAVTGDGRQSLLQLIAVRNAAQKRRGLHPTHNVNYTYVQKQGISAPTTIVPKGKTVYITNVVNYHNGCNTYHVPVAQVHPRNRALFVRINALLGLTLSGIDYMADDLSQPYDVNNHHVIEVNAGPDMGMHKAALPRRDIPGKFVQCLFDGSDKPAQTSQAKACQPRRAVPPSPVPPKDEIGRPAERHF